MTTFENKCYILSDLWMNYRSEDNLKDFIWYNDIGLPLSYMLSEEIVQSTPEAMKLVEETFDLLLAAVESEDKGFDSLDEILSLLS
jgi:hypothetical protein